MRKAIVFFFSSRRRHTRCGRDWSSDVCSSDLHPASDKRLSAKLGRKWRSGFRSSWRRLTIELTRRRRNSLALPAHPSAPQLRGSCDVHGCSDVEHFVVARTFAVICGEIGDFSKYGEPRAVYRLDDVAEPRSHRFLENMDVALLFGHVEFAG